MRELSAFGLLEDLGPVGNMDKQGQKGEPGSCGGCSSTLPNRKQRRAQASIIRSKRKGAKR